MSEQKNDGREEEMRLPELEVVCDHCGGKWSDCHRCGGTGYVPTPFGEKVLVLIQRHGRLDSQALL